MTKQDQAHRLAQIASLLADGLKTEFAAFPKTTTEFTAILDALRQLAPNDIRGKLVLAGFLDHPNGRDQMRCRECNYYLIRRKWCDLPEIALPVETDWWCRLWRI